MLRLLPWHHMACHGAGAWMLSRSRWQLRGHRSKAHGAGEGAVISPPRLSPVGCHREIEIGVELERGIIGAISLICIVL
jgi:hypothetical protein